MFEFLIIILLPCLAVFAAMSTMFANTPTGYSAPPITQVTTAKTTNKVPWIEQQRRFAMNTNSEVQAENQGSLDYMNVVIPNDEEWV